LFRGQGISKMDLSPFKKKTLNFPIIFIGKTEKTGLICSTILKQLYVDLLFLADDVRNLKYVVLHNEIKNSKHHRTLIFLGSFFKETKILQNMAYSA
jgi:hypothetical protein